MSHDRVFLGLGSNLGRRGEHLARAWAELAQLQHFTLTGTSRTYITEAQGDPPAPPYFNTAAAGFWQAEPEELLDRCQEIENDLGRVRPYRNAPRTIDIDVLFWEGRTIETPRLSVPHPRLFERAFALVPLLELAPDLVQADGLPVAGRLSVRLMAQGIRPAGPADFEEPACG